MFYDDEMKNVSSDDSAEEFEAGNNDNELPREDVPEGSDNLSEPNYSEPQSSEAPYTQNYETQYSEPPRTEQQYNDNSFTRPVQNTYTEKWRDPNYSEPETRSGAYTPGIPHQSPASKYQTKQPKEKKQKNHFFLKAVCLVLVCALVASAASFAVVDWKLKQLDTSSDKTVTINKTAVPEEKADSTATPSNLTSTGTKMNAEDLYEMGCQQVVGLKTSVTTTNIFGQTTQGAVSGSGFIISDDGYIVTNYHVIEYSVVYGYELSVILYDGTTYPASIIGYEDDNDVAVVKIDAEGLNAVTLGSSSDMKVGESIYAIGNPLGELEYTMTNGIVSALDRVITTQDQTTGTSQSINMFQIDAAVNEGNSGGPVYNSCGEVIGIVSAKYLESGVEGLGFAIPIDDAFSIVSDIIENGYVTGKAYFGIDVRTLTASYAQYYGLVEGAYVVTVDSGSCAEKAGIQPEDIITKLGDYDITSRDDFLNAKKNFKAGDSTSVMVYRNGEYLEFIVTFDEEAPSNTAATNEQFTQQQQVEQRQQSGGYSRNPFDSFLEGFGN